MIKVIIADDEPHFQNYMSHVIDWEQYNLQLCDICKTGEEVLLSVAENHPQIALLDINMPGMDGITLAEELKRLYKDMLIVFITGHSEFEYAKKALKIGVEDYLLKPFTNEELIELIMKMKLKIRNRFEISKQQDDDLSIVKERVLRKCIEKQLEPDSVKMQKELKRVGITFDNNFYIVIVIELDYSKDLWGKAEDLELWKFCISNIVNEIFEDKKYNQALANVNQNRIVQIVNYNDKDEIFACHQEIVKQIKRLLGISVSVGMGTVVNKLEMVWRSYKQAIVALGEKFFIGNNQIVLYTDVADKNREASFYHLELNELLVNYLRSGEKDKIREILSNTKREIIQNNMSSEYVFLMISGMLSIGLSYIVEFNGEIKEIFGEDFSPFTQLYELASLEDSFAFLEHILYEIIDAYYVPYTRRAQEILKKIESYIENNYSCFELTIENITSSVFLDSSYVRRLISKQKGCTISELLIDIRMRKAKQLIEQKSDITIAEVAEAVGYLDPGYFGKAFKKQFGIPPKQFMDKIRS